MERTSRHSLIKHLQATAPRGAALGIAALAKLGISAKLAARYVEGGWLVRVAHGVYAFAGDQLTAHASIKFLQDQVTGLHVGGRSALTLQGVRHNLASREQFVLWGEERFIVPEWFASRFPARYVSAKLFTWPKRSALKQTTLTNPPGVTTGLHVSVPERAILELLYDVGKHHGVEEGRNLFENLRNLRKDVIGDLLACCNSVKTVRLFLAWARATQLVDVDAMQKQYELPVGSESRWISRLKDGTLLSLRPHG